MKYLEKILVNGDKNVLSLKMSLYQVSLGFNKFVNYLARTYLTPCSSVSIVNFEHVNAGWEREYDLDIENMNRTYCEHIGTYWQRIRTYWGRDILGTCRLGM